MIQEAGTSDMDQLKTEVESLKAEKAELEKKLHEAQNPDTPKSDFLANMSHEMRTPMNSILGFTDILFATDLNQEQCNHLNAIKKNGIFLLSLINDILDLSNVEAGRLDIQEIDFDPELLAYGVCDSIRPKIESKPIRIKCQIGDNLPSQIKGDALRIRQVLSKLMDNAAKFTEKGEIELSVSVEEEKNDRIKLHAQIKDTGIGISRDMHKTVFDLFHQAGNIISKKYRGTGLGLTICKRISNLMDGDVWVESPISENWVSNADIPADPGSVFHFTLWVGKAQVPETKEVTCAPLTGKKVLIVDENKTNLEILSYTLAIKGMRVEALNRAGDAIRVLHKAEEDSAPFDICITDINMPDMSGYKLATAIRNFQSSDQTDRSSYPPPIRNLPLIALSSSKERNAKKCEQAGFDAFLSKPVYGAKLRQMMALVMGGEKKEARRKHRKILTEFSVKEDLKHSVSILLVEDNPISRELTSTMLSNAGYHVEAVSNGTQAFELYTSATKHFDLILMDIQSRETDGIAATKRIKNWEAEHPDIPPIPVVAVTADASQKEKESCIQAGMHDYFVKPLKRQTVFEVVDKHVISNISPA